MTKMLELSGWEFKTIVNNMGRSLMDNVASMQAQMGKKNENPKQESRRCARDKIHCNRNVECH